MNSIIDQKEMVWSLEAIQQLDWCLFEELCARVLRAANYQAETIGPGQDGCIDILAKKPEARYLDIAVQCKRWRKTKKVGVSDVREFFGAFSRAGYQKGIFITTSGFTEPCAAEFFGDESIVLVDGEKFLEGVRDLGQRFSEELLEFINRHSDWDVPTCPRCNIKMTKRTNKSDNSSFWGCNNFPKGCPRTFPI